MYKNVKKLSWKDCTVSSDMIGKPYLHASNPLRPTNHIDGKEFQFLEGSSSNEFKEFRNLTSDVFCVPNLLLRNQEEEIFNKIDQMNIHHSQPHRNEDDFVIYDEKFADFIWNKFSAKFLEATSRNNVQPFGFDTSDGEWIVKGVDEAILVSPLVEGKFRKNFPLLRREAPFISNRNQRSIHTGLIFVNKKAELIFQIPKAPQSIKGVCLQDEIISHGDLYTSYHHVGLNINSGDAVIFKHNVIYEQIINDFRDENLDNTISTSTGGYVLQMHIMMERIGTETCSLLPIFSPTEQHDYNRCLELFCEAKKLESDEEFDVDFDNTGPIKCYEKYLSILYSYQRGIQPLETNFEDYDFSQTPIPCSPETVSILGEIMNHEANSDPFNIFSVEIWFEIMRHIEDPKSMKSLCKAFPGLNPIMKKILLKKIIPTVEKSNGIYGKFSFTDMKFVYENKSKIAKVLSIYATILLGNDLKDKNYYLVSFNKKTKELHEEALEDILYSVFHSERVPDTMVFKIKQQSSSKDLWQDFFYSMDRHFLAKYLGIAEIGVDVRSEIRSKVSCPEEDDSGYPFFSYFDELDSLNYWDKCYETCERNRLFFGKHTQKHPDLKKPEHVYNKKDYFDKYNFWSLLSSSIFVPSPERFKYFQLSEKHNYLPSVALVRKLNQSISMRSDSCLCFNGKINGDLSKNSSTVEFNHLVYNFDETKLSFVGFYDENFSKNWFMHHSQTYNDLKDVCDQRHTKYVDERKDYVVFFNRTKKKNPDLDIIQILLDAMEEIDVVARLKTTKLRIMLICRVILS
eukprot:TCONS_00062466-protein